MYCDKCKKEVFTLRDRKRTMYGDIVTHRCNRCRKILTTEYPKELRRIGKKYEKANIKEPPRPEVGGI